MLVLDLKEGDYVTIGNDIKVYFEYTISRDSIKIAAPGDMKILRAKHFEENAINKQGAEPKKG